MERFIEQAKVMAKGQITLPLEIRKLLGVSTGDRISFIVNGDTIIMANSAVCALKLIQKDMEGEAEKVGINGEDDVIKLLKEKND